MVSYTGICQSQIVVAKAHSLEHVVFPSRAVLAMSVYCLQHLTLEREASLSLTFSVKFTGPQKHDVVLCAEEDDPAD